MATRMSRRRWLQHAGAASLGSLTLGARALDAAPNHSPEAARPSNGGLVRLSANENPYGPSQKAREAIAGAMDNACRYPFADAGTLMDLIAEREGVTTDHIVLGCGSGEVLSMAGMAYGVNGGEIVAGHPTYLGLTRYASTVGGYVHWVDLDDAMVHDLAAMDLRATQRVSLVFVCNPNNPTGTLLDPAALRDFCVSTGRRTLVFVDEAYNELTDDPASHSMVGLVRDGHNVLVARTFSKIHGMAGLRIGYGIARPDIIARISQYRMGGPNVLALHAAAASYQDTEFQAFSRKKVAEARQATYAVLEEVGYRYIPSETNFVFFHTGRDIADFQTAMQNEGVLVGRPFPPYRDWCRVSMGTDENMQAFADALRRVV